MQSVRVLATLVGVLTLLPPLAVAQQPNLSGRWVFVSGTTDRTRGGGAGGPTKPHTRSGVAFNCGAECVVVHRGLTLTIDQAQLSGRETSPQPAITLTLDGQPHSITDLFNPGHTIEAVGRWEGSTLLITTSSYGIPFTQAISLDRNELVLVTASPTYKTVLHYTKK